MDHVKRPKSNIFRLLTGLCCIAMLYGACAAFQARSVKESGFLGDYSKLKPGGEGKALLVYIDPEANIKAYSKIVMDPILMYAAADSKWDTLSKQDRQTLVNYASVVIREQLSKDYAFVDRTGPGIMRLRVAITEAEGSNVPLDTMSTIVPVGLAVSGLKQLATGTPAFVGSASVEAEMLDSQTGKRLFAAADRRIGGKITGEFDKFDSTHAVQAAFDYWADRLKKRLAEERAK
jgi:hypothetical protein